MAANFGRFKGDVISLWLPDGRNMQLTQRFAYIDPRGKEWIAPKGAVINGASIPGSLWSVVGGPYEGQYRHASVIHDVGCEDMTSKWEDVHFMFYEACRCGGVSEAKAKTMYYAVYNFGPRWQPPALAGAGAPAAVRAFAQGARHLRHAAGRHRPAGLAGHHGIHRGGESLARRAPPVDAANGPGKLPGSRGAASCGAKKKKPKKKPKG